MADIFISYAREDREPAKRLAVALEQVKCSVWWDPEIIPGETFAQVIEEQLAAAKVVIVLWSEHSISSTWVRNEAAAAAERGVLVPVSIGRARPPLEFRHQQTLDLSAWQGDPGELDFEPMRRALGAHLDRHLTNGSTLAAEAAAGTSRHAVFARNKPLRGVLIVAAALALVLAIAGWRNRGRPKSAPVNPESPEAFLKPLDVLTGNGTAAIQVQNLGAGAASLETLELEVLEARTNGVCGSTGPTTDYQLGLALKGEIQEVEASGDQKVSLRIGEELPPEDTGRLPVKLRVPLERWGGCIDAWSFTLMGKAYFNRGKAIEIPSFVVTLTEPSVVRDRDLIANGSFEEVESSGEPSHWKGERWSNPGEMHRVTSAGRSGSSAVELSSTSPNHLRWIQKLFLRPNTRYELSGWVRTEDVAHSTEGRDCGASLAIQWMNPTGIRYETSEGSFGTSGEWRQRKLRFETEAQREVTILLQLGAYSGTTSGTAFFDDIQLVRKE